jgi:hypothetical protein
VKIDDKRFHVVWTSRGHEDQLISSHLSYDDALQKCENVILNCASSDHYAKFGHYRISTSHVFN